MNQKYDELVSEIPEFAWFFFHIFASRLNNEQKEETKKYLKEEYKISTDFKAVIIWAIKKFNLSLEELKKGLNEERQKQIDQYGTTMGFLGVQ
jgi:ribosome-binding protein aMBF1 (putative translation factor)